MPPENMSPGGVKPGDIKDPYPRMIIVCICITGVLFLLIVGVLVFDFMARNFGGDLTPASDSNPEPRLPDNWELPPPLETPSAAPPRAPVGN